MNCAKTQRWLLTSDSTDRPDRDVRGHLSQCGQCLGMQQRLQQVEALLADLPVTPSTKRDRFIEQVRRGETIRKPTITPADHWLQGYRLAPRERGMRKAALAMVLAASLAIIAFGLWNFPKVGSTKSTANDPLAARQTQRDRQLAEARTPRQKVQVLDGIARNLQEEAVQLAKQAKHEDLLVVAHFYREVVGDNLLESARQLSKEERKAVLQPISVQLANVQSELERASWNASRSTVDSLQEMVAAARTSQRRLDEIIAG